MAFFAPLAALSVHRPRRPVSVHSQLFFSKKMAAVAPPGAVATALRHVRYQKQARSASDTRPHRDVPVTDAHRSRSLTCILTTDNDAGAGTHKWRLLYTYVNTYDELPPRVAGDLRGIHNRTRLRRRIDAGGPLAGPPSRPGAPMGPPCCSAEPLQSSFCGFSLVQGSSG